MSSPQIPFCVYDVNISFRVTKDDNLQKFIATTPEIQESRCSEFILFLLAVSVKFQVLVWVDLVHTIKILASEKKAHYDTEKKYIENSNTETRNIKCKWDW